MSLSRGMLLRVAASAAALSFAGIFCGEPARAGVEQLPRYLQETLAQIGPLFRKDIGTGTLTTVAAFRPLLRTAPRDGVTVIKNLSYGGHPRQLLDIYQPTPRSPAPIVIFVHGGAWVEGERDHWGEAYGNIPTWFARQGLLGINATYRLAPAAKWPAAAEDVAGMVAWAKANGPKYGGDPDRIVLMGHSAGATNVAGYVFDKALQPPGGPGIAGAVLISGRYRVFLDPADPNAGNMQAYFGADQTQYRNRSPITHIGSAPRVPIFIVIAEFENPGLDLRGAELFNALCERDGRCPRFSRLRRHNHFSQVLAFNTPDESLGREILDFIALRR